jgi:hypothetical protein
MYIYIYVCMNIGLGMALLAVLGYISLVIAHFRFDSASLLFIGHLFLIIIDIYF